jgi:hypothetical protein
MGGISGQQVDDAPDFSGFAAFRPDHGGPEPIIFGHQTRAAAFSSFLR